MAQSVLAGRIHREFKLENANFRPIHHEDVAKAVAHAIENP